MSDTSIYYASSLDEAFYQLKNIQGLEIIAGCTAISSLPEKCLPVRNIHSLKTIDKKERYIDFGSAVTLSEIQELGSSNLPLVLYEAVKSVANGHVKNLATLGGNICSKGHKKTLYAPLLALDARLEFQKDNLTAKFVPFSKFDQVENGWILTKVRIPVEEWDVSVFRRLGPAHTITDNSASFVFLADSHQGILANLRIAFAGSICFRNLELENILIGSHLPLAANAIKNMVEAASEKYDQMTQNEKKDAILKDQFLNLLKYSLEQLT